MKSGVLESVNAIETKAARVWTRKDGILVVEYKPGVRVEESDNLEVQKTREDFFKGAKQRVLVDARPIKSSVTNAWRVFEAPNFEEITKVMAFVSNRPVERHLLSFYFTEDPSAMYQTRLFTSMAKAEEWLQLFARIEI